MITEVKPSVNTPQHCDKCGGLIEDDTNEKRVVCINCGAQIYYGIPRNPTQSLYQFWPLILVEPRRKYQPTRPGAIITLGHGTSHFEDTGCKDAPRCQNCPFPYCKNPGVWGWSFK
jgi:DNA-directed RNA polymerase subunit RPC12/RpoP